MNARMFIILTEYNNILIVLFIIYFMEIEKIDISRERLVVFERVKIISNIKGREFY